MERHNEDHTCELDQYIEYMVREVIAYTMLMLISGVIGFYFGVMCYA